MSDIIDRANDLIEAFEELSLRAARGKAAIADASCTGECLYCGESVPVPARWCDGECRDAWEFELKRR